MRRKTFNILLHPRPAKWGGPAIWMTRIEREFKKRGYKCTSNIFHYTGLLFGKVDFAIVMNTPRYAEKLLNSKIPVFSIMGQPMNKEWCEIMKLEWLPTYEHEILKMIRMIEGTKKTLFISNYVKNEWKNIFKERKLKLSENNINVILHGVETDKFTPGQEKNNRGEFTIGSVGALRLGFRLKMLFESSKLLKMDHRILLIGSIDSECQTELENARRDPNIKAKIEYLPWIDTDELPKYYRQMDCLYHPVIGEAFGNVVAEALSCGVPVVCPEFGGSREFVLPNGGVVVKTKKWKYDDKFCKDMAIGVTKIWKNLEVYKSGARRQAETISMEKIVDQYLEVFEYPKNVQQLNNKSFSIINSNDGNIIKLIKNIWQLIMPEKHKKLLFLVRNALKLGLMELFKTEFYYRKVIKNIDLKLLINLHNHLKDKIKEDPECAAKYTDFSFWLRQNVIHVLKLRLDRKGPIKILDLGCGAGYFLSITKYFGHNSHGLDTSNKLLTEIESVVFNGINKLLNNKVKRITISPFKKTPIESRYDLITGFLVTFNNHKKNNEWSKPEWEYFIEDIKDKLNDGGLIYMELNENRERYGKLLYYDKDTFNYFKKSGKVDKNQIIIMKDIKDEL